MSTTQESRSQVDIRRSHQRFHTQIDWLDSHHCFSFSGHYDPRNTHHGLLLVSNDDVVKPNTGFRTHPHQDMEIVTWVLDGELEHKDSEGNVGMIYPGLAQRMSDGTGILHSEMNPQHNKHVHFIQMWVPPDTERIAPGYQQLDINDELTKGGLVPIASGRGHSAAITIQQKDAVLWGGRLKPGVSVEVPDALFVHLFIAKGSADLEGAGVLQSGDAARLTTAGARRLIADAQSGAEVLIWETNQDFLSIRKRRWPPALTATLSDNSSNNGGMIMATQVTILDPAKAKVYFEAKMAFTTGPVELERMMKNHEVNVVDVRAAEDYAEGHIPGAINLPKDQWPTLKGLRKDKTNVLYCYSHVCHLAATAAVEFAGKGYPIMELDGGWRWWRDDDFEIEK